MQKEIISYNGKKFIRYPESKSRSERVYYSGHFKINGVNKKIRLHVYKYLCEVGEIPIGYHIHHKDHNPLNNEINNLECKNGREHISEHGKNASEELKDIRRNILHTKARPVASLCTHSANPARLCTWPTPKISL